MYVCLCQAVREAEVRDAVASGARDVEALAEALGVCMGCGICREAVEALIDQYAPHAAWGPAVGRHRVCAANSNAPEGCAATQAALGHAA